MTAKSRRDTAAYIKGLEEKSRKERALRDAAPELLAALKECMAACELHGADSAEFFNARDASYAAIARAEGRLR